MAFPCPKCGKMIEAEPCPACGPSGVPVKTGTALEALRLSFEPTSQETSEKVLEVERLEFAKMYLPVKPRREKAEKAETPNEELRSRKDAVFLAGKELDRSFKAGNYAEAANPRIPALIRALEDFESAQVRFEQEKNEFEKMYKPVRPRREKAEQAEHPTEDLRYLQNAVISAGKELDQSVEAGKYSEAANPRIPALIRALEDFESAQVRFEQEKNEFEKMYKPVRPRREKAEEAEALNEDLRSRKEAVIQAGKELDQIVQIPDYTRAANPRIPALIRALEDFEIAQEKFNQDKETHTKMYAPVGVRRQKAERLPVPTEDLKFLKNELRRVAKDHDERVQAHEYTEAVKAIPALTEAIDRMLDAPPVSGTVSLSSEMSKHVLTTAKLPSSHNPRVEKLSRQTGVSEEVIKQYRPELVSPLPGIGKEDLEAAGLQPKHTITAPGQKMHVSDPYDIGDGRVGFVAYVEVEGETYVRSFYRSNSRGDWQSASHHGDIEGTLSEGNIWDTLWIGKGAGGGKSSTVLPILVQKELSALMKNTPVVHPPEPKDAPTPTYMGEDFPEPIQSGERYFYGVLPFGTNEDFANHMDLPHVGTKLQANPKIKPPDPKSFEVPKKLMPKFDTVVDRFEVEMSEHYEKPCEAFVFDGELAKGTGGEPDIQLRYMFVRDGKGRVFLSGVEDIAAPMNVFGVRTRSMEPSVLGTGLIEYKQMMKNDKLQSFIGDRVPSTSYVKVKPEFHDGIPILAKAKEAIEKLK